MTLRLVLFGLVPCFIYYGARAQLIESNSLGDRNYAFQVKHLEEFFERFNNMKTTYHIEYVKNHYPGVVIDRQSILRGLFNNENKKWSQEQINDFIFKVTDSARPLHLNFYGGEWFAETQCKFKYLGKQINVTIILRIKGNEDEGSKWLIMGAHSINIIGENDSVASKITIKSEQFINPFNHITYFTGLNKALGDRKHIYDYLDSGFLESSQSRKFLNALLKKKLLYQYVHKITFHFLQIDGWIFTVNEFARETANSGWLISSMQRAESPEKSQYKRKLLE
jgi:hypothetical protein